MKSSIMLFGATGGLLAAEVLDGGFWANATALAVLCYVVVHLVTRTLPDFIRCHEESEKKHAEQVERRDAAFSASLEKRDDVLRELTEAIYTLQGVQKKEGGA